MALEFPHAEIVGVDLAPNTARYVSWWTSLTFSHRVTVPQDSPAQLPVRHSTRFQTSPLLIHAMQGSNSTT